MVITGACSVVIIPVVVTITQLPRPQHNLLVDNTEGGLVTTAGQGTCNYDEGTTVRLVAQAEEGYRFVDWSGDVDTIPDTNATETTIVMNDDYSITASFEEIPPRVNWPLIVGIIGAVVAVGLTGLFIRRRRTA